VTASARAIDVRSPLPTTGYAASLPGIFTLVTLARPVQTLTLHLALDRVTGSVSTPTEAPGSVDEIWVRADAEHPGCKPIPCTAEATVLVAHSPLDPTRPTTSGAIPLDLRVEAADGSMLPAGNVIVWAIVDAYSGASQGSINHTAAGPLEGWTGTAWATGTAHVASLTAEVS
jgi:hypothetical protein